jgi:hypothetical protein
LEKESTDFSGKESSFGWAAQIITLAINEIGIFLYPVSAVQWDNFLFS